MMNRREFLMHSLLMALLAPAARLLAKEGSDGDKASDISEGLQVMRRRYKNTALTLPLLGFGCMRLPLILPSGSQIDKATLRQMVARAMKAGCNYFDTAYMYHNGESERCMGEILKEYPRDSFYLADKMPVFLAGDATGVERIFKEQLERCQVDYFDFYLVHSVDATNWKLAKEFQVCEFLERMQKAGKIRKLGFSFHDTPEVLKEIIQYRSWDFVQLQLNCLDWELYHSREQYEIATQAGVPVMVMEPLRGGTLANLAPEALEVLKQVDPQASAASWAMRFVGSLPNVLCVLSGMSLPEHLEDNLKTYSPLKPLSEPDYATLEQALVLYRKHLAVPCTGCKYCIPCPVGVDIPRIFGLYNQYKLTGNRWLIRNNYGLIPEDSRASACVECGVCRKKCPQKINIPLELKEISSELKG